MDCNKYSASRTAKVYFPATATPLRGQGALSQARVLEKNCPASESTQPAIPKDATVVVVAGPQRSLFDQEVKALSDYLNQGGSLLLMIDPIQILEWKVCSKLGCYAR